eukprot:3257845-Amphidinium_carterae.1
MLHGLFGFLVTFSFATSCRKVFAFFCVLALLLALWLPEPRWAQHKNSNTSDEKCPANKSIMLKHGRPLTVRTEIITLQF